jgi:cell division initiation protein
VKITPLEIKQQEFKKVMRGYDTVEVNTFLDLVGSEFEKLLHQMREYDKKIIALEAELNKFREVESTLKQTLMNVQESSDKSLANSKKEANLIIKESELEAQKTLESARRERDAMKEEVITLRTQKHSLIARLRHVLTSQLELMDVLELDDMDMSKLKDRTKKTFSAAISAPEPAGAANVIKNADPVSKEAPVSKLQSKTNEDGTNLFKDVFGDNMDTFVE